MEPYVYVLGRRFDYGQKVSLKFCSRMCRVAAVFRDRHATRRRCSGLLQGTKRPGLQLVAPRGLAGSSTTFTCEASQAPIDAHTRATRRRYHSLPKITYVFFAGILNQAYKACTASCYQLAEG